MVYELAAYTDNKDGESFIFRENLGSELSKQPSALYAQRNLQFSHNNYILQLDYLVFLYTIGRML